MSSCCTLSDTVSQEEDLSTNTGGFALCEDMTEEQVSASLLAEEEELQQQVKAWKAAAAASKEEAAGDPSSQAARGEEGRHAAEGQGLEALLARVRLRRGWYAVVCHLSKGFKSLRPARKSIAYAQTQLALVRCVSCPGCRHMGPCERAGGGRECERACVCVHSGMGVSGAQCTGAWSGG